MVVWFTFLTDVLTAKEANMQKCTKYTVFDVRIYKVVIDEEELHGIEIDGILNLENLSRTVFID